MGVKSLNAAEISKILDRFDSVLSLPEDKLYRKIVIKQKNGKFRVLHAPCAALLKLQRMLIAPICKLEVSKFAQAYEQGCSTLKNAQQHIKANHILHMDLKDFFPSISRKIFEDVFCGGLEYRLCERLWKAVGTQNGLPIGAPTSPFIANRVVLGMDKALGKAVGFGRKYTRYADDLIFSSKKFISDDFRLKVERIIKDHDFTPNSKKTYFMSYRKAVTGIMICKKRLTINTGYKKRLKSQLYDYLTKNKGKPMVIRGKLAYLKSIQPDYYATIKRKYKHLDRRRIFFR